MAEVFEVVLRWGDTILDVQYVREAPLERKRGLVDVFVRATTLPPRSIAYARGDDRKVLPYIALALGAHLAFWAVANSSMPPPEQSVVVDEPPKPRVARIVAPAGKWQSPMVPRDVTPTDRSLDTKPVGRGAAMRGAAGEAGDRRASSQGGRIEIAKASSPPRIARNAALEAARDERGRNEIASTNDSPQIARDAAIEAARNSGILGSSSIAEQLKTLSGSVDLSSGFDGATVTSQIDTMSGVANGTFGVAYSGERHGGGGKWDTIGMSEHRGLSKGDTPGDGWGGPAEHRDFIKIPWLRTYVCSNLEDCVAFGDLSQKVILRYTWRKARQLQNCRAMNPSAPDDMIVDFKIERSGRVQQISAPLDCIADVYKSIRFPRSRDIGTQVRHTVHFMHHTQYF